jgi:hypothetical protein
MIHVETGVKELEAADLGFALFSGSNSGTTTRASECVAVDIVRIACGVFICEAQLHDISDFGPNERARDSAVESPLFVFILAGQLR